MENVIETDEKAPKRKLSLSLRKRRFAEVSEPDLVCCKKKAISANSERAYQWAIKVFKD